MADSKRGNRFRGQAGGQSLVLLNDGRVVMPADSRAWGGPIVKAWGGPIVKAWGGPVVKAWGGPIVKSKGGPVVQEDAAAEASVPDYASDTEVSAWGGPTIELIGGPAFAEARSAAKLSPAAAAPSDEQGKPLTVLGVHGIGDQHTDLSWQYDWTKAILKAVGAHSPGRWVEVEFMLYDDLVAEWGVDELDVAAAIWRLGSSGIVHGIGDLFRRGRGLFDIPHTLRWTAGMVAQWAAQDGLRRATRDRLEYVLKADPQPYDVVLAHSLGSLVCYDTFSRKPELIKDKTLVTFGSQIATPFVRSTFGGRISALPGARAWYHLYNPNDRAFTAQLDVRDPRFTQVITEFDEPKSVINHSAVMYLSNANTIATAWRNIAQYGTKATALSRGGVPLKAARAIDQAVAKASRPLQGNTKALLVGINDYPDPAARLAGCANDVYLVSSVLQELEFGKGAKTQQLFPPENIRVVLNERATTAGILERLHWLLDDAQPGDTRVLFYSGHGAQIPSYGAFNEVDHMDECLVPYDFDWSPEHAITDDQFLGFYSQLPVGVTFLAVFDCCHSGGIARGNASRARGLNPPDDIRHRAMRWDRKRNMWVARDLGANVAETSEDSKQFWDKVLGSDRMTHKLGGAAPLRRLQIEGSKSPEVLKRENQPFMPLTFLACQEQELAFEYEHGVTSYGAFTYSLASVIRAQSARDKGLKFEDLCQRVNQRLHETGYKQTAMLNGPKDLRQALVPWKPMRSR